MKLINGFDLMNYAKERGLILPAFNTTNMEMTYAIAKGLDAAKLPGYIQISSNNLRLSNPYVIAAVAKDAADKYETPIGLHLDHGRSFADVKACVDAGFTSIMVDASALPFEENIKESRRTVEYCHFYGIPVEVELGALGGKEDDISDIIYNAVREKRDLSILDAVRDLLLFQKIDQRQCALIIAIKYRRRFLILRILFHQVPCHFEQISILPFSAGYVDRTDRACLLMPRTHMFFVTQ